MSLYFPGTIPLGDLECHDDGEEYSSVTCFLGSPSSCDDPSIDFPGEVACMRAYRVQGLYRFIITITNKQQYPLSFLLFFGVSVRSQTSRRSSSHLFEVGREGGDPDVESTLPWYGLGSVRPSKGYLRDCLEVASSVISPTDPVPRDSYTDRFISLSLFYHSYF